MDIQFAEIDFTQEFQPFSIEELNERIDKSLLDSKHNRVTESDDLLAEIKEWH